MKKNLLFIGVCAALVMAACEDSDVLIDAGYNYFPINRGLYVDYEVDSIYHDVPAGIQDTFRFYVRELIDTTFFDAEGRPSNRIERYYKDSLIHDWELRDIWVSNRTNERAEKVEENVRIVKMVFPITEEVTWDGNAQNVNEEWEYSYVDLFVPKTIGDTTYQKTVRVEQRDVDNLIRYERGWEVYAENVGLVYKQLDTLKFSLENGSSELESGVEFRMSAIGWGDVE